MRTLVTGATGYIGGRLVPALLDAGHQVICLARTPSKLDRHSWNADVTIAQGDVLDAGSLATALEGVDVAYYLVHSMGSDDSFSELDRTAATNFRNAAEQAGVRRIVYLGGLGDVDDELSKHLRSRHEVGEILRAGSVPVTELRAAVIIGSGSVSFEMLRYLAEVLPVMVTPRWVRTRCQPIAIRNVLEYLVGVIEDESTESHVYEIGGPDVVTYETMLRTYAEVAGLPRRVILAVPVLSPQLSSRWIGLVTPLPVSVARPLVDSLRNEVVVTDARIQERHPASLIGFKDSIGLALMRSDDLEVPTRWSDTSGPAAAQPTDPSWSGGTVFRDEQVVAAPGTGREDLFWAFSRIGGSVGYYAANWAWKIRGVLDSIIGGVGLRRGRKHPERLHVGESLDFWRVMAVEPGNRIQLLAEMKLPGDGWLEFAIDETDSGLQLRQIASFVPRGLFGRLYWHTMLPFHLMIFGRMARRIVSAATLRSQERGLAARSG